ncbi:MAG TPA: DUF167 domain-containing protein [Acidimicrobiia bacterium]|nr:DUF167 domain-containing protein [Acidimicrobiia bacterium]
MIIAGKDGVYIDLHVHPNARQTGLRGIYGERLKITVTATPESGRANEATVVLIAELLDVPRGTVSLVGGATGRRKRVHVDGIDADEARELIAAALTGPGRS